MDTTTIVELLGFAGAVIGVISPLIVIVYRKSSKFIKRVCEIIDEHEIIVQDIKTIKKEITRNSGSSLRDAIDRMEKRQIVLDQRSKAVFHHYEQPIFEITETGDLEWGNNIFFETFQVDKKSGMDWVSYIDESCRAQFLEELNSCLDMSREIRIQTQETNGVKISFKGFPYKTTNDTNFGFLVYLNNEE